MPISTQRLLRANLFRASRTLPFRSTVRLLEGLRARDCNRLSVLTYHRVDEPGRRPDLDPALISASPADFKQHIAFLRDDACVLSLQQVLAALQGEAVLPPRAVLITFDDAYRDFALHAWPTIRAASLPVTLFVPTAFPGEPQRVFWWDRLHHALLHASSLEFLDELLPGVRASSVGEILRRCKRCLKDLPHVEMLRRVERIAQHAKAPPVENDVLDWDALRRLAREGVTLAPHTRTHPVLTRVPADEVREEIGRSFADLRRELGEAHVPPAFGLPSGAWNAGIGRIMSDLGVQAAFTTDRGVNRIGHCDPLRLARINVARHTPFELIRLQLAL